MDRIVVRGAREHNLKNVDVDIPRDELVVITGPSGSGKSSLAFDTIYAEGQRRYVESLSTYARQFLDQQDKPDVDRIEGLSPAISIEQRTTAKNPRSTVGTLTEIHDYLRVLYARVGRAHCDCGKPAVSMSVQEIVDAILAEPEGTKLLVLAPLPPPASGELAQQLKGLMKDGFTRARLGGEVRELGDELLASVTKPVGTSKKSGAAPPAVELVIDRLIVRGDVRQRLTEAVELALQKSGGAVTVAPMESGRASERTYREHFACETCGFVMPELTPQLFSFNSPRGACEQCEGLGTLSELDPARVIPDPNLSLDDGAIKPWSRPGGSFYTPQLAAVAAHYGFSMTAPWKKLPKKAREVVLYGSGKTALQFDYTSDSSRFSFKKPFEGVMNILKRRLRDTDSEKVREDLQEFMSKSVCPSCDGARLNRAARRVQVGGKSLVEATHLSLGEARAHFEGLVFGARDAEVARPLTKEVLARLSFLSAVGLDYLSLDRASTTLSGGEAQRIRLATQVGSALQGVVYVLDEPSIGLHQRDNERLIRTLQSLRDLGNTVLVVEHDEDTIRAADHVIDMGPGAGLNGGRIVAQGTPAELERSRDSLTGQYLSGRLSVPLPVKRRKGTGSALVVRGARGNNLKNIDATFPLGTFTCVTGVSGSGKSTLVNDTLYEAVARHFGIAGDSPAPHDGVDGLAGLDKVIAIDQSPIGRTPRSNPATYTGIFQLVRDLFAGLPEARARGYGPGRFSFNVKGGRCETCEGDGVKRIEMHFLPDVFVVCDACHGARYNRDTLEVHYKDKSIAQVLAMTVAEAQGLLGVLPQLGRKLDTLAAVGLGYVSLGQAATTLSGGEAQRIKLARELSRRGTGRTLYILDEPTTGLHVDDVKRLLEVLHELVDQGNTVVVIEHQLDVIKTADWVIDLGPEGGNAGGALVAAGTPEEIARSKASHTGRFLARMLDAA